jgi:hypothetical protein
MSASFPGSINEVSILKKMNAVCVISGCGIRSGAHLPEIENIEVAPTAARLLGLSGLATDGRVIDSALAQ